MDSFIEKVKNFFNKETELINQIPNKENETNNQTQNFIFETNIGRKLGDILENNDIIKKS